MSLPLVLVFGSRVEASKCIIKGIVKDVSPVLEEMRAELEPVQWNIENKYYEAEVGLLTVIDAQNTNHIDFNAVEAVIIYINNKKGESLATADKRRQVLSQSNAEINILLCDMCEDSFPREQAMVWCLDNDYQLIELHEEPQPVDDTCPIQDHYGFDRVIHTLHTHLWSNHEPKHECMLSSRLEDLENNDGDEGDEEDSEYMDEFCKLYAQMSSVTQNAASLPTEGRKAYAEQVVKAFWKAIGGDESELDDTGTS